MLICPVIFEYVYKLVTIPKCFIWYFCSTLWFEAAFELYLICGQSCLSPDPDTETDLHFSLSLDLSLSSAALSAWCCCLPLWLNSWARSVTAVCSPREWGVESRNSGHHSHREKCCRGLPPVSQRWAMRWNFYRCDPSFNTSRGKNPPRNEVIRVINEFEPFVVFREKR